jgi:hypothetical protein
LVEQLGHGARLIEPRAAGTFRLARRFAVSGQVDRDDVTLAGQLADAGAQDRRDKPSRCSRTDGWPYRTGL